jgi:hypothetical protein
MSMIFKELPPEILDECKKQALLEGGCLDVDVDVDNDVDSGGFNWGNSEQGGVFWCNVLDEKNYDLFYEKYPKESLDEPYYEFMKKNKLEEAVMECYRELYKAATPSADFDKLVEEAPLNKHGQKEIDFMAYEIDADLMEDIVNGIIKKYKIKPDKMISTFRGAIYLGASPKTKRNESKIN